MPRAVVAALCMMATASLIGAACTPASPGGTATTMPGGPRLLEVEISAIVYKGDAPGRVGFRADVREAAPGGLEWSWDLGNGDYVYQQDPMVIFPTGGVFDVVVIVTDSTGAYGTATTAITITGDTDDDGFYVPTDCDDDDASSYPGAPDPAGDGIDQDCDELDGASDASVFVRSNGADTPTCGEMDAPCATVAAAQARASDLGRSAVLVAGGTYPGFELLEGMAVRGGYPQNWRLGSGGVGPTHVAISGGSFDDELGGPVVVTADGIAAPTVLAEMTVRGASAPVGQPSHALVVRNSTGALRLEALTVVGGTGGAGRRGADGTGPTELGWAIDGSAGTASEGTIFCNDELQGRGGDGAPGAGDGGDGGKANVKCKDQPGDLDENLNPTAGQAGGAGGAGGTPGSAGRAVALACDDARGGDGGRGNSGSNGAGGVAGTATLGARSGDGGSGGLGTDGVAGGGGGGAGGCFGGFNYYSGGGGGGGGAGGRAADRGGAGGTGGGRSVGVLLQASTPTVINSSILAGEGGRGGDGGHRGYGQSGGRGGAGGAGPAGEGGHGGDGGDGGLAGAGGGGAGGAAIGLGLEGASVTNGSFTISGGVAGVGGVGGPGGPNGPAGQAGPTGLVRDEAVL